jgi:hypothetical protein
VGVIFEKGQEAEAIPDLLGAQIEADPVVWVILRLREASIVNTCSVWCGGPKYTINSCYALATTVHLPGIEHEANEEVQDLSLNKLMVANMYYIRKTAVVRSYIVLHRIVMVVVCMTALSDVRKSRLQKMKMAYRDRKGEWNT